MIDIGANLASEAFSQDIDDVIARAKQSGVTQIIVTGSCIRSNSKAIELASKHNDFLLATAGLHPHHASQFNDQTLMHIREAVASPQVVAIGETGLDFNRNFSPAEAQINAFESHLALAGEFNKPLFLHERDAYSTFSDILSKHSSLCNRTVVHCFTGSKAALKTYLDLGCYIGITGWICDEKRGKNLREIIGYAPIDRVMIESDAPYLTPHKKKLQPQLIQKHRNEPWTLSHTANALAKAMNISNEQLIEATVKNTKIFFALAA